MKKPRRIPIRTGLPVEESALPVPLSVLQAAQRYRTGAHLSPVEEGAAWGGFLREVDRAGWPRERAMRVLGVEPPRPRTGPPPPAPLPVHEMRTQRVPVSRVLKEAVPEGDALEGVRRAIQKFVGKVR